MKTTELIAEILVIGVGAGIWVGLLLLALFPETKVLASQIGAGWLLPAFVLVYVFGIITDKLIDVLLKGRNGKRFGGLSDPEIDAWKNRRDEYLKVNEYSQALYLSNQSRRKIVRGWIFNFFGIAVGLTAVQLQGSISLLSSTFLWACATASLVLSSVCFMLWERMGKDQVDVFYRLFGAAKSPNLHAITKEDSS